MADKEFDFNELKELKIAQYKKTHLKPAIFKKCKGAIIFVDYKMAGKKTPCVIVPFKKENIAAKTFKSVKKNKEHILKKTAFASLEFGATPDGKTLVTIELKKGGLGAEMLTAKAAKLFGEIKMEYKVVGLPEGEEGAATDDNSGTETADPAAAKKQALQLVALFKAFAKGEWAAVKENPKSAKVIMAADKKGQAISARISKWLAENTDNSDLTMEFEAVSAQADKLTALLGQIKATVDKIKKAQGEKSNVDLDTISVDITGKVADLMSSFAKEIESIDGLKAALDAIK